MKLYRGATTSRSVRTRSPSISSVKGIKIPKLKTNVIKIKVRKK